ncbi:MAG: hypothetical protein H6880_05030 [Rhodobiaceae bacterium]|nr:hypothetical protein [Rhodobiaceae bacterium]
MDENFVLNTRFSRVVHLLRHPYLLRAIALLMARRCADGTDCPQSRGAAEWPSLLQAVADGVATFIANK